MLKPILQPERGETRFIFVSGKGGVGKTTTSAAVAVRLAREGHRTLIVSTDLQRSLDDVFGQPLGSEETPIRGVRNLWAVDVDPAASTRKHREKIMNALEVVDPGSIILQQMRADARTECGAAQASVYEMNHYLNAGGWDAIVFDTAPLGIHLEKILNQSSFVRSMLQQKAARDAYAASVRTPDAARTLDEFDAMVRADLEAVRTLSSPRTSFVLVMTPEAMPLAEVKRSVPMLEQGFGIAVRAIVVNEILSPDERAASPFWAQRGRMQDAYLDQVSRLFPEKRIAHSYLVPEVDGIERLERIGAALFEEAAAADGARVA